MVQKSCGLTTGPTITHLGLVMSMHTLAAMVVGHCSIWKRQLLFDLTSMLLDNIYVLDQLHEGPGCPCKLIWTTAMLMKTRTWPWGQDMS